MTDSALTPEAPLSFECRDDLPCFTRCCRDVNIYLSPHDVLRLRRALGGMPSGEFLSRHTRHYLAKGSGIPVVQLRMTDATLACPFVGDAGCGVYGDRPWACRMFPLDLGGTEGEYRLMAGPERCCGVAEGRRWTVGGWLENQGVPEYEAWERAFRGVMPEAYRPGLVLDPGFGRILYLAWDLDEFREMLRDPRFRRYHDVSDEMFARAEADPEALLMLAFQYIRSELETLVPLATFGETP